MPGEELKQVNAHKKSGIITFCASLASLTLLGYLVFFLESLTHIKGFDLKQTAQSIPLLTSVVCFALTVYFLLITIGLFQRKNWLRSFFWKSITFLFLDIAIIIWFLGPQIINNYIMANTALFVLMGVLIELNKKEFEANIESESVFIALFELSLKGMIFLQIIAIPAFYVYIVKTKGTDYLKNLNYIDIGYYQTSKEIQNEVLTDSLDLGGIDIRIPNNMQLYLTVMVPYAYQDPDILEIKTKNLYSYIFVEMDSGAQEPKYTLTIDSVGLAENAFGMFATSFNEESVYDFEYKLNIPGFTGFFTLVKPEWLKITSFNNEIASSKMWKGFIYRGETEKPHMKIFKTNIYSLDKKRSIWLTFSYNSNLVPEDLANTVFESMLSSINFHEGLSANEYLGDGKQLMLYGHYQEAAINCINAFAKNNTSAQSAYCAALALFKYSEITLQSNVLPGAYLYVCEALRLSPDLSAAKELKEKLIVAANKRNRSLGSAK